MKNGFHKINTCEVCGNEELASVLDLGLHPMCDDLVRVGDARVCREYPIEILFCENCYTAHQRFQVPKQVLFPTSYHYRSRFTVDVLNGMAGLVESCEQRFGILTGKKVLDIGCNDGSLLDFFRQKGAITIAVEPTDACRDAAQKGHITFNNYFSEDIANAIVTLHGKPDFITFTNVFAHIENFREVLGSLKQLVAPHTVIVIENHYLGAVLDGNQFDTFYHEHLRTYSYTSCVHMAPSLGLQLLEVEFPSRYGGNIRMFLGNTANEDRGNVIDRGDLSVRESQFFEDFASLRKNLDRWRETKKRFMAEQVRKRGKLRAKAFPGRAAILAKLLGLNEESISAVYEKPGSLKIGHYVPGTRIPICSDEDLFNLPNKTQPLLNLAWHIPREIRSYLTEHGYTGPIIDIVSAEDFVPGP
ncbi:class I SAM-dependent methyltransferase [Acidobacteria bacterium AH-259-O06]|nr:class I SAM-dependent methyltransferase [Acidobacteria bacterium AH-259-O06]